EPSVDVRAGSDCGAGLLLSSGPHPALHFSLELLDRLTAVEDTDLQPVFTPLTGLEELERAPLPFGGAAQDAAVGRLHANDVVAHPHHLPLDELRHLSLGVTDVDAMAQRGVRDGGLRVALGIGRQVMEID